MALVSGIHSIQDVSLTTLECFHCIRRGPFFDVKILRLDLPLKDGQPMCRVLPGNHGELADLSAFLVVERELVDLILRDSSFFCNPLDDRFSMLLLREDVTGLGVLPKILD